MNKKYKASLIKARNKLLSPLKVQIEKLEAEIIILEKALAKNQEKLIKLSSSQDSSELVDLYKEVASQEKAIEEEFEHLSRVQEEHDGIVKEYALKIGEE
jgi:predicted  nucleic acid-binding Zn-ribbon protein